jgi:hypothetical protein
MHIMGFRFLGQRPYLLIDEQYPESASCFLTS